MHTFEETFTFNILICHWLWIIFTTHFYKEEYELQIYSGMD